MLTGEDIAIRNWSWTIPIKWSALLVGLLLAYAVNLRENWIRWFPAWHRGDLTLYERVVEGESYYTHAPLVPIISTLSAMWILRFAQVRLSPRPGMGFMILGISLLAHLTASLARVNFASGFTLLGAIAGIIVIAWGIEALRRLWFPLALLVFMLPLPEVTIAQLNFRLKMLAAGWGVTLANALGIITEQSGNKAFLADGKTLTIANVCNGLRTLISLLGFGAIYAYVCTLRSYWRASLFLLTVPVALAANSIRIAILIAVAHFWNVEAAQGWFHDASGLMIYALAFLMMFGIEKIIIAVRQAVRMPASPRQMLEGIRRSEHDEGQCKRLVKAMSLPKLLGMLIPLLATTVLTVQFAKPQNRASSGSLAQMLPRNIEIGSHFLHGFDLALDDRTLTVLEMPEYLYRQYSGAGLAPVDFCLIFSRDNRKGVHPPDLCLEGGGQEIVQKRRFTVNIPGTHAVPFRELIVRVGEESHYFMYTYKSGGGYTTSFWRQQWTILIGSILRRDSTGALIRISTPVTRSLEDARARSTSIFLAVAPHLEDALK